MKVVYLTGAPGSGKTTALNGLLSRMSNVAGWRYSERLSQHIQHKSGASVEHEALRRASATLVSPDDIAAVDAALVEYVGLSRASRHVIIDSHPVTKEHFGFRCTPFSVGRLTSLGLDEIWITYLDPATTLLRLDSDQTGRQAISREEAAMHSSLQASIAIQYGILAGCPVYFFDASAPADQVVDHMQRRLLK